VIHRPTSSGPTGRTRRSADQHDDNDDMATDIVKKARQSLRERAEACRSPGRGKQQKQAPEEYAEHGIYDDSGDDDGAGGHGPELETCMEGENESSMLSPRAESPEVRRVDKYLEGNQWEHNAVRPLSGTRRSEEDCEEESGARPRLPATATDHGDIYETKIRISKPITRTHSVGGRELSEEELEVERRKGELLGGRHLGGQYRGANEPVTKNVALTQGLIRKLAGSKSNGSMYTWVDMMNTAKSNQKKGTTTGTYVDMENADTRGRSMSPHKPKDGLSWSARRATMTSPEVIARRMAVMDERKADRTQWHEALRDEALSPAPAAREKRPSSAQAAVVRKSSSSSGGVCEKMKPVFAVRSGQDLKTITYVNAIAIIICNAIHAQYVDTFSALSLFPSGCRPRCLSSFFYIAGEPLCAWSLASRAPAPLQQPADVVAMTCMPQLQETALQRSTGLAQSLSWKVRPATRRYSM
jgi:hypothetical protein